MTRRMKGAIIGCGFFGQIELDAWRRIPEVEIVVACDLKLERAREAAPHSYTSAKERGPGSLSHGLGG